MVRENDGRFCVLEKIKQVRGRQAAEARYDDSIRVAVGSGYRPDVLAGRSHLEIARSLSDPTSAIARGIIGNANHITAAICEVTGDQPASVCSSAAVRGLAR